MNSSQWFHIDVQIGAVVLVVAIVAAVFVLSNDRLTRNACRLLAAVRSVLPPRGRRRGA